MLHLLLKIHLRTHQWRHNQLWNNFVGKQSPARPAQFQFSFFCKHFCWNYFDHFNNKRTRTYWSNQNESFWLFHLVCWEIPLRWSCESFVDSTHCLSVHKQHDSIGCTCRSGEHEYNSYIVSITWQHNPINSFDIALSQFKKTMLYMYIYLIECLCILSD